MNERAEFLKRPDVESALAELGSRCFEVLKETEGDPQLPDPKEFLRGREVDVPDSLSLKLEHTVSDVEAQPEWFDCGDGVKSRPRCEWINGRFHCFHVCP
jgi:hypothetical protein